MKISLHEHGGIAAATRLTQPPRVLDVAALPAKAAAELVRLLAAAHAAHPAAPGGAGARDAMHYTITIDDDGHETTLAQGDAGMTDAFAALLDWLQAHLPG